MKWFDNHKKLFGATIVLFLLLTVFVAIVPAMKNDRLTTTLPGWEPLSAEAMAGKKIYISNGCVACHTQQVRNVEMDRTWGARPTVAADYAGIRRTDIWRNTATLMGTERTGPDLTDLGKRNGSAAWNLTHLYNPRILVDESVMPAYPWLFEIKENPEPADVVVTVPPKFMGGKTGKVVAKREALQLLAYLQSLKQVSLPDGMPTPEFLFKREKEKAAMADGSPGPALDGNALYATHCQSCHQANGEGLAGAFPSLSGSKIVMDSDISLFVEVIMNGYSGRVSEGFGIMPAVGHNAGLSPEEVTAIVNHERTNFGNEGATVSVEDVKKIMDRLGPPPQ